MVDADALADRHVDEPALINGNHTPPPANLGADEAVTNVSDTTNAPPIGDNGDSREVEQPAEGRPEEAPTPATATATPQPPTPATENPRKRRRMTGGLSSSRPSSVTRVSSPPWKKAAVEGPTSFVIDGRRKSSRTNLPPPEMQPEDGRRRTRGKVGRPPRPKNGLVRSSLGQQHSGRGRAQSSSGRGRGRGYGVYAGRRGAAAAAQQERVSQPSPSRRGRRPSRLSASWSARPDTEGSIGRTTRKYHREQPSSPESLVRRRRSTRVADADAKAHDAEPFTPPRDPLADSPQHGRAPRLRLRLRPRTLPVLHPYHIPAPKKFGSLSEWLEHDNPLDGEDDQRVSEDQARRDAHNWTRILEELEPGGLLTPERCSLYLPDPGDPQAQQEAQPLPQQYGHWSHVAAHALHLRKLMQWERRQHLTQAKRLAYDCREAWRVKYGQQHEAYYAAQHVKTREELDEEQRQHALARHRQLIRDVRGYFELARAECNRIRLERWRVYQHEQGKQAFDELLDQSTTLLSRRRAARSSSRPSLQGTEDDGDEDESDNDSEAGSGDERIRGENSDDELTHEELQAKYGELLAQSEVSAASEDSEVGSDEDEDGAMDGDPDVGEWSDDTDEDTATAADINDEDSKLTQEQLLAKYKDMRSFEEYYGPGDASEGDVVTSSNEGDEEDGTEATEVSDSMEGDEDDGVGPGLLGFLSKAQVQELSRPAPAQEDEDGGEDEVVEEDEEDEEDEEGEEEEAEDDRSGLLGFFSKAQVQEFHRPPTADEGEQNLEAVSLIGEINGTGDHPETTTKTLERWHAEEERTGDYPATNGDHLVTNGVEASDSDEYSDDDDMDEDDESDEEGEEGEEEDDDEENEDDEEEEADQGLGGLLGFYSKKDVVKMRDDVPPEQEMEDHTEPRLNGIHPERLPTEGLPNGDEYPEAPTGASTEKPTTNGILTPSDGGEVRDMTTPATDVDMDSQHLQESEREQNSARTSEPPKPRRVGIPSLLRGTLREYQHDGLDWLANLYANGTNGILADEMGLGKTIQTIALLAHIAVDHGVWGPHLVVVPTSVMLNWEMEFKKWCPGFKILTYYGDLAERKRKRTGWQNDDLYNVVITSYQLILQDQGAFKRRGWHYLILDEAHNIKNFKTQRWQTLLTFRTEQRLLLTGTPLQNNISELWSLLAFLMPAGEDGAGGFAGLENFTQALSQPTNQILEQGKQELDANAQGVVKQLHSVLRPYLLRRLKADVEKQMPAKYEHVVYCRLSKRQRQLYDGFMGRADTRQTLSSGNYLSIINCLMSLRKVCNHPDLFETRQIVTSFAMPKSVVADYEIKALLVRRRMLGQAERDKVDLDFLNFLPVLNEARSALHARRVRQIQAVRPLHDLVAVQTRRLKSPSPILQSHSDGSVATGLSYVKEKANASCLDHLRRCARITYHRSDPLPAYGKSLVSRLDLGLENLFFSRTVEYETNSYNVMSRQKLSPRYAEFDFKFRELVKTQQERSQTMDPYIRRFGCVTPATVANDMEALWLTPRGVAAVRMAQDGAAAAVVDDPFHEARIRLSIAFPDKRLLQYDCGKLQRLDKLLRQLQSGGHRALIFTQMTKVLDILEQFLNIHGHRYLRLDGATRVEQRQLLTDRFNNDPRIPVFILSSRSGGLGINLTGADTVIFYDLDWNPAMDRQCQDRCHRIGQTRDVHVYRFVSEHTIEANILRKSNQKRLLDDVIIQRGDFTTDYFNRVTYRDALGEDNDDDRLDNNAEASAAMDRVLGEVTGLGGATVLGAAEDDEDAAAAQTAQKEVVEEIRVDEQDFKESGTQTPRTDAAAPTPLEGAAEGAPAKDGEGGEAEVVAGHVDDLIVGMMLRDMEGTPVVGAEKRGRKKKPRDPLAARWRR